MKTIDSFISDYEKMTVEVSPNVSYNLRDVIEESYRLFNARFQEETDANGFKKIFYRMIWVIFRTIIMSSDIDLKDMHMRSLNGLGVRTLALFKLATRSHLLRTGFGKYVDKVMAEMVWFGSSLTKRVNGSVETVDLRNYITQPNIKNPQERSHVEYAYYSYDEMQALKDDIKDWEAVETLWKAMKKDNLSQFTVLEYWTWIEEDGKEHKGCIKYLDTSLSKPDNLPTPGDWDPYTELYRFVTPYKKERESEELKKKLGQYEEMFPYEQADLFDCPGRWLAFGCAELLAGLQEHYNENYNLKRKKDVLDLRGIFVHKYTNTSNSLTQEFLEQLETGSVLQMDVNEDLQRLIIDTKTAEFINNVDKLYEIMRLVMGVTAQGTGEELPGSTSATGVKANFASQQTTYDYVRERMHHFLQTLFMNGYFEDILDGTTAREMVAISGSPQELSAIDAPLIKKAVRAKTEQRYNALAQMKGYVTWDEVDVLQDLEEAEIKELGEKFKSMGDTRWSELKKDFLKGFRYVIEFFVNSETFDKQSKLEFLQMRLADPNFTGSRKAVEDAIFDLMDENPRQFDKTEEEKAQEVEMARQEMMMQGAPTEGAIPPINTPV